MFLQISITNKIILVSAIRALVPFAIHITMREFCIMAAILASFMFACDVFKCHHIQHRCEKDNGDCQNNADENHNHFIISSSLYLNARYALNDDVSPLSFTYWT